MALKFLFPIVFLVSPLPATAQVPLGLWEAMPDGRGVVVHVRTGACGSAICGQIERAKDRRGYDTPSQAIGRRILLDMEIQPDGSYAGQIWEPERNRLMSTRMRVQGNRMLLENCDSKRCENVAWHRLR